jgi:glutaminase
MAIPIDLLQQVSLFSRLSRKQLEQLSPSFKELTFSPGENIATEGAHRNMRLFVVAEGSAMVTVGGAARGTLGPGESFGEIALIDGGDRSATVTAETQVRCYGLSPWEFRPLVEANREIAWELLRTLAGLLHAVESEPVDAPTASYNVRKVRT